MADSNAEPTPAPPLETSLPDGGTAPSDPRLALLMLSWDLEAQLAWLREAGVGDLPIAAAPASAAPASAVGRLRPTPALAAARAEPAFTARLQVAQAARQTTPEVPAPEMPALLAGDLGALRDEAERCTRCPLARGRAGIALGNGVARAELMFVGERPVLGPDGAPQLFADEVQALLDKMIRAMGREPSEVACADVIQCASAEAEAELPFEAPAACRPLIWTQIALIRPRVIVALGKLAAQTLLQVSTPITRLRGQWQDCAGMRLMPTFHPAYLLKNPDAKRQTWRDLQQVMAALKG